MGNLRLQIGSGYVKELMYTVLFGVPKHHIHFMIKNYYWM